LITITRLLAKQLATIMKRLIPRGERNSRLLLRVESGPKGLLIEANGLDFGFRYQEPGRLPKHSLIVPPVLFEQVSGSQPTPVTLKASGKNQLRAEWYESVVPKSANFAIPLDTDGKPVELVAPNAWAQNSAEVLSILHQTMAVTDKENSRYALGNIQVQGKRGEIAATDGHQVLWHTGIKLNFDDEILVPTTTVYGSPELRSEGSVLLGKTDMHFAVQTGPWTIFTLIQKEGRFPRVRDIFPSATTAKTTLQLSPTDCKFLSETIPQLPCDDERHQPITVDLKGKVAIRARGEDGPPTELVLQGSRYEGPSVRIVTNRTFVVRALKLGFDRILVHSPGQPLQCCDSSRQYVWMTLEDSGAIPASKNAIVIESPAADATAQTRSTTSISSTPHTIPMRRRRTQFASAPAPQQAPAPVPTANGKSPGVIEQVTQLREVAQDLLTRSTELLRTIKRQKKQHRLMQSTLQSLNQLQNVA